ncbi:MAG: prefoldin subunit beta [Thermoplasmata archaeon HGW-Thermoplasmata-1]|nr:MAG: prefoldin subunit beta [Thermoplasmata archaeon HGW-Thermoplasmata-1]
MHIPPHIQNQFAQLQQFQQQLQVVSQQRNQMEMQGREIEKALDALEKLEDGATVYKNVGALFVKTGGKKEVSDELGESKETLEVRIKSLEKQEARLKESLIEMQSKLRSAMNQAAVNPK